MAVSLKETRNLLNKLVEKVFNEESMISSLDIAKLVTWEITGGASLIWVIYTFVALKDIVSQKF